MAEATYVGSGAKGGTGDGVDIKFSHVQLYVDSEILSPLDEYKELEASMNRFQKTFIKEENDGITASNSPVDIERGRHLWESMQGLSSKEERVAFVPHGRDVVKVSMQCIVARIYVSVSE